MTPPANILKCDKCNLVVNELLTFVQQKHEVMDSESLVRICNSAFTSEDIEKAKLLLFQSISTSIRNIKRKKKEGKSNKELFDIIEIFKSLDPEKLPIFVAHDLNKLPPITFDHVDVSRLLKDIVILQSEIKEIKSTYVTNDQLLETKEEITRLNKNCTPLSDSLNQTILNNSYRNINFRRGACLNNFEFDSGPMGIPHMSSVSMTAQDLATHSQSDHTDTVNNICNYPTHLRASTAIVNEPTKPVSPAPIESLVRVEAATAVSPPRDESDTRSSERDAVRLTAVSDGTCKEPVLTIHTEANTGSGLPPSLSESSSRHPPHHHLEADAAELVRDAPLYPPLKHPSNTPQPLSTNQLPNISNESLISPTQPLYTHSQPLDTPNGLLSTVRQPPNTPNVPLSTPTKAVNTTSSPLSTPSELFNTPKQASTPNLPLNTEKLETSIELNNLAVTPIDGISETEKATKVQNEERVKRSSGQEWSNAAKSNRRVKTGDTILNIRGAVRDAIGDAGAAPGPRASSRLDTFVIRPAAAPDTRQLQRDQPRLPVGNQAPKNERELLVEAHSRARIPCELTNVTGLRWYKDHEQINVPLSSSGEALWRDADALVIARATRADAAAWRCAGVDRAGKSVTGKPTVLLIYEPVRSVYLAVDGRRLDAGNTWVPVRDKTVLEVRCLAEGGVPAPELTWRLLAVEPALDHRPYLRIHHTNYSIDGLATSLVVVTAARELHNATLQCEARQRRPPPAPPATPQSSDVITAKLQIHVTYPPSFVISRWPGFGISLAAGSAAALRCDVDANPPARAWWLRDDAHTSSSPPPLEAGDEARGSATLRWAALRTAHAGWYRCRATWLDAEYSSIGYYLNVLSQEDDSEAVTDTKPELDEPDHQKVDVPVGGNVQLHCPKGSVGCWWRRVVGNSSESWAPAGSHHAHGVLGIKDALYQEGGEYRCVGARAPDLQRLKELKRVTLRVTGGATATALSAEPAAGGWRLECGACGRALRVLWLRGGAGGGALLPASLAPDLAQHCWRAVLHVSEPDEVWCIAVSPSGGAVAVFPPRAPHPSPAPARHSVRALLNSATLVPTIPPITLLITSLFLLK